MDKALLFYNGEPVLVTAEEVLEGKYPRDSEFVDAEYPEYKVRFICAGKPALGEDIGSPYFRLYYSYEEYKKLFPDRGDKYEIVAGMRRFQENPWHREWKERLSSFCETEKYFRHENRWKYADAYDPASDTCIELQHSYTSFEFEDRNQFYTALNKDMIWLFHLPRTQVREGKDGLLEILEDNARGFFRAAYEAHDKFNNVGVFIQTKSKRIYRVRELFRRKGSMKDHMATVRYFRPDGEWTEDKWLDDLRAGKLTEHEADNNQQKQICESTNNKEQSSPKEGIKSSQTHNRFELYTISELWKNDYKLMVIDNGENVIYIYRNKYGGIRKGDKNRILFQFEDYRKTYIMKSNQEYGRIWRFVKAQTVNGEWIYSQKV